MTIMILFHGKPSFFYHGSNEDKEKYNSLTDQADKVSFFKGALFGEMN